MILAIDFGGTQVKSALVSEAFELAQVFDAYPSPKDMASCLELIDQIIRPHLSEISGIAFSFPGTVDDAKGVLYKGGLLTYLDGFAYRDYVSEHYHLPVSAINDGKAAALAEYATGQLKGCQNGLAMVLGSGLGGGIILHGQVYQGSNFQAGELTFMVPPKQDALEEFEFAGTQVSAVNMIRHCARILELEDETDGRKVFDHLNQKDSRVYPIFESYCRYLAIYINNVQAILDLDKVVLGGGISSQAILLEELERQIAKLESEQPIFFRVVNRPAIAICQHKNGANLIGAAYHLVG
ncbi:ROK family protein [Streptococcus saliviloxodontae]|uniref:NBD/HSP70 family sugar kinase n=1 Tax=Streptococcus saliviloxodontae TaxID=1349416 RepID=A0ABS2PKP8_9STRE|nr:ROK family protein [Streptococcus saliviloxodontae]MBM7635656.1 putative NBD/HSP70 family sugar kinase [Streptococcus saliviloxodontae]